MLNANLKHLANDDELKQACTNMIMSLFATGAWGLCVFLSMISWKNYNLYILLYILLYTLLYTLMFLFLIWILMSPRLAISASYPR